MHYCYQLEKKWFKYLEFITDIESTSEKKIPKQILKINIGFGKHHIFCTFLGMCIPQKDK